MGRVEEEPGDIGYGARVYEHGARLLLLLADRPEARQMAGGGTRKHHGCVLGERRWAQPSPSRILEGERGKPALSGLSTVTVPTKKLTGGRCTPPNPTPPLQPEPLRRAQGEVPQGGK